MYIIEESERRFCVKPSTLPDAGLGCFAMERIAKGDYLEVIGVYVPIGSPADICTHYANRYKFAARDGGTCYIVPMGYGGMVNHTDDKALQNCELRWLKGMSKRSQHAGQVVYMALRDIEADEELLGNYGEAVGAEIRWAKDKAEALAGQDEAIEEFLGHDLYNLDLVKKF